MKKLELKKELTPEEQAALAEREEDLELFEQFEMPLFFNDMLLHGDLYPDTTLEALNAAFYFGIDLTPYGVNEYSFLRGCLPVEGAKLLYDAIRSKRVEPATVAQLLKDALARANDEIPF